MQDLSRAVVIPDRLPARFRESYEPFHGFCVMAIVRIIGIVKREISHHSTVLRVMKPNSQQLVSAAHPLRRPQQQRIHKSEHRRIHSDPQCQCHYHRRIRYRPFHEHPKSETNVLPPLRWRKKSSQRSLPLLQPRHVSKLQASCSLSILFTHPSRDVTLLQHRNVLANLLIENIVFLPLRSLRLHSRPKHPQVQHRLTPAFRVATLSRLRLPHAPSSPPPAPVAWCLLQ